MLNPNDILAGKTYEVLFSERTKIVHITERTGFSPESYCWKGTVVETGRRTIIRNEPKTKRH